MSIDLVLHEPEQPGNTGAIGRTCLCAGSGLHLIRPLGFSTDEKSVRRAGLDYWPRLRVREYDGLDAFYRAHPNARIWYLSTKAEKTIAEGDYRDGDFLMLGKESAGLHSDGRGRALAEPVQRRGHRPLRGPPPHGLCRS